MMDIPRREERLIFCDAVLELWRILHRQIENAISANEVIVSFGVLRGSLENRPFTAHKLAQFLGVPRSTLIARLDSLIKSGHVKKKGRYYYTADNVLFEPPVLDDCLSVVLDTADKLLKIKEK